MAGTYDDVITALKQVIDPELGINIVDLGLVYEAHVLEDAVLITMTMAILPNLTPQKTPYNREMRWDQA